MLYPLGIEIKQICSLVPHLNNVLEASVSENEVSKEIQDIPLKEL